VGITGVGRDVSEKKRIEAELRRQQQHLLEAQAIAHVGSWEWDIVSGAMEWSEEQFRIFGYEPKAIPTTCETFLAALHPHDHDRVVASINDTLEGKTALDVECRVVHPDGEIRTVHYLGRMICAEGSTPVRLSGSTLDITDRKQAESALRQSESHFRALIENSSDIITVLDLDGTIRFESPSFERLLGYTQHEIDGRIAFDFIHPDDLPTIIEKFQRIVQQPGEPQTAEFRFRHQDGSWLSLEGVGRAACDSHGRPCVIANSRDITERKRAERSLLQTRDLLTSFVENTPAAVAMLDRELRYVAVSRRWLTDYRLGDEPLVGRRHYEVFPEIQDMKEWQEIHQRCLSGSVERREEDRFVRADGSEDWLRWEVRPWHDVTGEIGGIIIFTEVITERKQAEVLLRSSQEKLRQALHASNTGLWDWNTETNEVSFSPEWKRQLGHDEGDLPDVFETWESRLHPDDRARAIAYVRSYLAHPEEEYRLEFRLRHKDGSYRWIEARASIVTEPDGRRVRLLGSHTDITARKQTEVALHAAEAHQRVLLKSTPAMIYSCKVTDDFGATFVSENVVDLLGYRPQEFIDDPHFWINHIHPDDRARVLAELAPILETDHHVHEYRFLRKDGTYCWLHDELRLIRNEAGIPQELIGYQVDITDRKRVETEVAASKKQLQDILDTIFGFVALFTVEGRIIEMNRVTLETVGVSKADVLNRYLWEGPWYVGLPDMQSRSQEWMGRAAQGEVVQGELVFRVSSGELAVAEATFGPLRDASGAIINVVGFGVNITERKRVEAALQQSEAHFRAMIENSSDIITVLDLDGTILFESPSFERLLGYAQHEIDGRIAFDFIHPDDLPAVIEKFQRIVQQPGETQTAEFRFRHQDGSWLSLEGVGRATRDARSRSCVIVNSRDITERKRAEAALRISQERYARATAVGKVGVWELDVATGSYHGDVNLKALFGYGEDELSTDPYVWLNLVHPDDRSIAMAHWQRVVRGEADGYNYELRMVKKDGTVIWTDVRGHAVRSNEGQVKHLFGATVDITERKRTEQALREREGSLARFKATLDQVHDCVFMFSADSLHFVYCNRGAVMQVGYTEDELLTMKPLDIKPEFTERTFREMLEPLRDGSCAVQVFETLHRHKDGHDVAVEVSLQFVAEAGQAGLFAAVVRDITERKHAQEALRLSEERFRSLFENSPIAYQSLDREGRFLDVNQRLCHLLGYEREELLGSDFGDLWAGNVDGDFSATFEAFKKSGKVRNELALRRRDGTIVNAVIDGRIQRDQKGEFIRTHCILTDITERAQAEEALRRSEARLKEAQRIAHIGSWELDLVANRLTWSDEIYRIFEIDAEAFGASYEAFLQLVHPDDRSLVDRAYTESVTFRTPYNITHRLLMADGRIKFVREQCETQYGRDGLALRSSGTVQDITKQKEAEEALAQNHTLLTAIMDASIDLISIKDLQGRYVHINRAGAEAVGMPAEAVIGWDDVALWGGAVAASRRASDRFVTESGQTITVEEQGTLLDDLAHYLTTKAPYRDSEGSIIGVIGIARNITKWKRVEEERQKALTLLTNVINATPDLIFVKDCDLRTILCNNSFAQAIGKTPEDLIGRSDIENGWDPELVKGNFDEGFPGYESDDRQALAGKVVHNPSDPVNVNGEVRIFDTYKVPLRDETGGVIGILGMSRDVTERKRMEEMLRQRERDVRAAIEERERISEDLHDGILQSIFAVGLGLESCRTLVAKLPRKKAATPLMAGLNRAIGQLNHVMTDVRNFIAGIESHVLEEADIGQTLRTMVQAMCASNGTACRVTIEEAAVRELSTEQAYHAMNVIREALSNSLRHSEAGRITLSFKRLRRSVRLSVTDNGKGFIPDSARDAGHGLINMSARARKLGGRIEVHSRPRQGTKVLLDIPGRPVDE
jgi:PAS domain S-box-containing protein